MPGASGADVPDRYDVVFTLNNGTSYGFLLSDAVESSLPFRTHKAIYSYSATFLERENLSNSYGDNFADFFLTGTQADFSEGEGQKFFRVNDADSVRRYWQGQNVDTFSNPGNAVLTQKLITMGTSVDGMAICRSPLNAPNNSYPWYAADTTNLYKISPAGAVTTIGAHGIGAQPTCMVADGYSVYMGHAGGVRKYSTYSGTFSTFSTSVTYVEKLAFLNNILFAYSYYYDTLYSLDTSGVATSQFAWENADGTTLENAATMRDMIPYGGTTYMIRQASNGIEIWVYDGAGCRVVGNLPPEFTMMPNSCVSNGILYIGGTVSMTSSAYLPTIYYYVNGSIGKLWQAKTTTSSSQSPAVTAFEDGILFSDPLTSNTMRYDIALGGVNAVCHTSNAPVTLLSGNDACTIMLDGIGDSLVWGNSTSYNSSGYIQTSQYDFDNTLTKYFRGLKIDADIPANSSVDIAYQIDGAGGSYTTLQTGVTSGVEYDFPSTTTGHSISVKVTLNSATGSATPTLKHVYVRAAPTLQQFRYREFIFDLSGGYRSEAGKVSRETRDGTPYPYDPLTAANNLTTVALQTVPFTVYDRFALGGYTAITDLQPNNAGYDGFAIYEERPGVFIARINLREV